MINAAYCLVKGFSFEKYVRSYLLTDMQVGHFSSVNFSSYFADYEAITPGIADALQEIPGVKNLHILYYIKVRAILSAEEIII